MSSKILVAMFVSIERMPVCFRTKDRYYAQGKCYRFWIFLPWIRAVLVCLVKNCSYLYKGGRKRMVTFGRVVVEHTVNPSTRGRDYTETLS